MRDTKADQLDRLFSDLKDIVPFPSDLKVDAIHTDDDTLGLARLGSRTYRVHYYRQLSDVQIGLLLTLSESDYPPLVVTNRIKQEDAEELRKHNIPFLDTRGNAYINLPEFYVYIVGRSQTATSLSPTRQGGKLFNYSGIKLLYALLTDPNLDRSPEDALLNDTLRNIASMAHISLGSVSNLFREMKERGYLAEESHENTQIRWLLNREELFRKWVHGYCEYRPRRNVVRFQTDDPEWWRAIRIEDYNALWGGEAAAVLLTEGFLVNPQVITIYTDETMYGLVLEANLQKVESDGNVELMAPLHGFPWHHQSNCVHPLLIYADLIYSTDDRNREAAERIHDKHLHRIINPAR